MHFENSMTCPSPDLLWPRWQALMATFSVNQSRETFERLVKAYSEPHRAYHTLAHITACLNHLDEVRHKAEHPHEIELALWFHDAIYQPFSKTNEEDSAEWAKEFMTSNGFASSTCDRVFNHIIITKEHVAPANIDAQLLLDIDLSILGTRDEVYDQFEKDVRFEYRKVPGFLFRRKRKEILKGFLARKHIYQTQVFQNTLEMQARHNLSRTIADL